MLDALVEISAPGPSRSLPSTNQSVVVMVDEDRQAGPSISGGREEALDGQSREVDTMIEESMEDEMDDDAVLIRHPKSA